MKTIHNPLACLCIYTLLLLTYACTGEEPVTGDSPAETGTLQLTQAQVLTGMAQTRVNITHNGGVIWVEAYDKTDEYELDPDSYLTRQGGDVLTMPRTSKQAEGLAAYGYVTTDAHSDLPVHVAPDDYTVTWNTTDPNNHVATITNDIPLTPAVAALNIILKDANGGSLNGFDITTQGIYKPATPNDPDNWTKDSDGTYQIATSANSATGRDKTDIIAVPTTLNPGAAMVTISGGSDDYANKTWIANVPADLTALEPGKRYNLTVTLNGERASITVHNITDWNAGGGKLVPNGYDVAVYTWKDLKDVADNSGGSITKNIIQMANIVVEDNDQWSSPILSSGKLYNGNGYTITGLEKPLFGAVYGWVYNTHLRALEVSININNDYGLLAGYNTGIITLCSATGSLTYKITSDFWTYVGGLVGHNDGFITRSYTDVALTVDNSALSTVWAGGLAGINNGGVITACATFGKIEGKGIGTIVAGSVVGINGNNVYYSYALESRNEIGDDGGTYSNIGPYDVETLVKSTTADRGIDKKERSFHSEDGAWWTESPSNSIDFTYEGL